MNLKVDKRTGAILDHNKAVMEIERNEKDRKVLLRKVGKYKKKVQRDRLAKAGSEQHEVVWTIRVKIMYILHCWMVMSSHKYSATKCVHTSYQKQLTETNIYILNDPLL